MGLDRVCKIKITSHTTRGRTEALVLRRPGARPASPPPTEEKREGEREGRGRRGDGGKMREKEEGGEGAQSLRSNRNW